MLLSSQVTFVCEQPDVEEQESIVQANPSSQFTAVWLQEPSEGLQESSVQTFPSSQFTGVLGTHEPFTGVHCRGKQKLVMYGVQSTWPVTGSLHNVQFAIGVKTHPEVELQLSVVHGSPSLHVMGMLIHPACESHESVVHALWSSQLAEIFRY